MTNINKAYSIPDGLKGVMPLPVESAVAPSSANIKFPLGQIWLDTTAGLSYILAKKASGAATWNAMAPGASDVDTINSLAPTAGNIIIDGGTNLTDSNGGSTVTMNMDAAITLATSVTSALYTTAAATDLLITAVATKDVIMKLSDAGGVQKFSITDSADAEVFSIDSDGALSTLTALVVAGAFTQTAGIVSISEDNSANAVGIANGTTARTVSFANSAAAHLVTIGSVTGAAALTLRAGQGNFAIVGDAATTYTIGAAATGGTFAIGGTAQTGDFDLCPSTAGMTLNIANDDGAKVVNIGAGVSGNTISVGNGINTSAQIINVANGASAANTTLNIMSGIGTVGAGIIALGNNTRVTTVGIADIAPAAARAVTICGGDSAQNDTFSVLSDNPSANTQTFNVLAGVPTGGTQVANILTQTGQAGTINVATGAAMANAVNIGGTGACVIALGNTQTGGSVSIGDAMTGGTIDIGGSGAQVGTITLSASTATQAINIANVDGTKTLNIANGVDGNQVTIANGVNTTSQTVSISGGASAANSILNLLSGNVAAGTSTLNLATGTGGKTVNIANGAGVNAVVIGSTNSTSALTLQSGTNNITMTGTVNAIAAKYVVPTGIDISLNQSPVMQTNATTGGAATGATGDVNLMALQEGVVMEQFILGAGQTIISPRMTATGLNIALDQVNNEGAEYNFGAARVNSQHAFTIGTSAAFRIDATFTVTDSTGCEPLLVGFRKSEANNSTMISYTDYAAVGLDGVVGVDTVILSTRLNSGGVVNTDTTDAFTDGQSHKLSVLVSAAGVVTYLIDDGAPSATAAFTFDNADVVCPFIHFLNGADVAGDVELEALKIGFQ